MLRMQTLLERKKEAGGVKGIGYMGGTGYMGRDPRGQ